jgi:hypothetical protein
MNLILTFENLVAVIRECTGIPKKVPIAENSRLEEDLGITGDDGDDLLLEIQKRFSLSFVGEDGTIREIFGLEHNQYLFHGEGSYPFEWLISLFSKHTENVKTITVGQLYEAAVKAKAISDRSRPNKEGE